MGGTVPSPTDFREHDNEERRRGTSSRDKTREGLRKKMIDTSHLSAGDFELTGPALLRKTFHPRQRLTITEVSEILGLSRNQVYRRIRAGTLGLRIQRNECGIPFVRIDDLIRYLFPDLVSSDSSSSDVEETSFSRSVPRRPGRPRKSASLF